MCQYTERQGGCGAGDNSFLFLTTFLELPVIIYSGNWLSCMETYLYFTISGGSWEHIWDFPNKRLRVISKQTDRQTDLPVRVRPCQSSLWRPMFDPSPVCVGFVVDKVWLGLVLLRVLRFSPINTTPPMLNFIFYLSTTDPAYYRQLVASLKGNSFLPALPLQ
jgi:hypothetical protein